MALNKIRSPGLEVAAKRLFKTSVVALASVCHGWAVEHPAAYSSPGTGYGKLWGPALGLTTLRTELTRQRPQYPHCSLDPLPQPVCLHQRQGPIIGTSPQPLPGAEVIPQQGWPL